MAHSTKNRYDIPSDAVAKVINPAAAGEVIYAGTMVCVNAAGFAIMAQDAAGLKLVGISEREVDNSAGADGDVDVPVQPITALRYVELDAVTPLELWVGDIAFFTDDHTVDIADPGNGIIAGTIQKIVKTGATGKVLISLMQRDS